MYLALGFKWLLYMGEGVKFESLEEITLSILVNL